MKKNKKKNELAKIALAAFMLSAGLPAAGNASDAQASGTLLAGGGCGGSSNKSGRSGCGASSSRYSPKSHSCGGSEYDSTGSYTGATGTSNSTTPKSTGCGASTPRFNSCRAGGCGAATNPTDTTGRMNQQGRMSNTPDAIDQQGSSYQGTTTGPGPNDGYPATPRGSYDTNYKPNSR